MLSVHIEARGHAGGCPLCSAGIASKSDQTTQQRMSRKNQDNHWENFIGQGKDEFIQRQNRRDRASEREEESSSKRHQHHIVKRCPKTGA